MFSMPKMSAEWQTKPAGYPYRISIVKVLGACAFLTGTPYLCSSVAFADDVGSVVVRVDDPSGTHCIDSSKEKITIFLRRVFVEKHKGIFTEDNRAGVLVRTALNATGAGSDPTEVKVPAVDMVSVKEDSGGRVSLALEYPVATNLVLQQGTSTTQSINLLMNLAKTKDKNSFGQILDIAGQALGASLLPANPYTAAASKFLKFANQAIDTSISSDDDEEIAHFGLQFNSGAENDIKKCEAAGNERTGALVALRSIGKAGTTLIPITDTEKEYCLSYSSANTYELTAAHRKPDGSCPASSEFSGVNNDYVMMLLSATPVNGHLGVDGSLAVKEAQKRCRNFKLPLTACGVH